MMVICCSFLQLSWKGCLKAVLVFFCLRLYSFVTYPCDYRIGVRLVVFIIGLLISVFDVVNVLLCLIQV